MLLRDAINADDADKVPAPASLPQQQQPPGLHTGAIHQAAGCCCVMQWMLPAFSRISRDFTPTTCATQELHSV